MTVIDEYLAKLTSDQRAQLERIRQIAKEIVPDAQEIISYGMPTLQYQGKSFLGFNAHKNHIGIYPYGGEEIEVFKEQLAQFITSKGAIQVSYGQTFPENLLKQIVKHRINRIINS